MTPEERVADLVARLRQLHERATPGPWTTCLGSGRLQCTALMYEPPQGKATIVADFLPEYVLIEGYAARDHIPNLKLVEEMRTALPSLLDEIDRLSGALTGLLDSSIRAVREQQDEIGDLKSELTALRPYIAHEPECGSQLYGHACDCGLDDALKTFAALPPAPASGTSAGAGITSSSGHVAEPAGVESGGSFHQGGAL